MQNSKKSKLNLGIDCFSEHVILSILFKMDLNPRCDTVHVFFPEKTTTNVRFCVIFVAYLGRLMYPHQLHVCLDVLIQWDGE